MQYVRRLRTVQLLQTSRGLPKILRRRGNVPDASMRARQQLVRALIADIIADVDEKAREVILTITGKEGSTRSCGYASQVLASTAAAPLKRRLRSSEACIVDGQTKTLPASLNRMGMRTGQDMTWNAHRVSSLRCAHGIHAYGSAEKNAA